MPINALFGTFTYFKAQQYVTKIIGLAYADQKKFFVTNFSTFCALNFFIKRGFRCLFVT